MTNNVNFNDGDLVRIESIHKVLVPHTAMANIRSDIELTIMTHQSNCNSAGADEDRSTFSRSNNICLFGDSGTGKTTMCNSLVKKFSPYITTGNGFVTKIVPTFYTSVPSPITIKGCANNMLRAMGVKNKRGTADSLTHELVQQLKTAKTNMIIIDEFHHLLNNSNAEAVGKWIKNLINKVKIPIMLVGIPSFEALIDFDTQISSRFVMRHTLTNFSFNPVDENKDLERFVKTLAREYTVKASLDDMVNFGNKEELLTLYIATGGSPDCIATIFKAAAKYSLIKGNNSVTLKDFEDVYSTINLAHSLIPKSDNPFKMSLEERFKIVSLKKVV